MYFQLPNLIREFQHLLLRTYLPSVESVSAMINKQTNYFHRFRRVIVENHPPKNISGRTTMELLSTAELDPGVTTFIVTDLSTDCGTCQRNEEQTN